MKILLHSIHCLCRIYELKKCIGTQEKDLGSVLNKKAPASQKDSINTKVWYEFGKCWLQLAYVLHEVT